MMLTVWKFHCPIDTSDIIDIEMPFGAEVLRVGVQTVRFHESLVIWARVDADAEMVAHRFYVCGTGFPVPSDRHVGTIMMGRGEIVLHVFQQKGKEVRNEIHR
jgi:hypothetical protein